MLARLLTCWIPISKIRRCTRSALSDYFNSKSSAANHKKLLGALAKKINRGQKIRVAFYVVFDSVFPTKTLFEKMREDDLFDPFILVIPDTLRGKANMVEQLKKSYQRLSQRYGELVYLSYDEQTDTFADFSDKSDLISFANPYDAMTHPLYQIKNLSSTHLSFFANYYYFGRTKQEFDVVESKEYGMLWKIFLENENSFNQISPYHPHQKDKFYVSGYIKMDDYEKVKNCKLNKNTIILAPHHTIFEQSNITLSTFLDYADFYLELPKKYPDITFIFRPHPLLAVKLSKHKDWGGEKVKAYFESIERIPNMVYDTSSDYLQSFAESLCLIHDCGSFLAEYFYTGKPQCYLLKKGKPLEVNFTTYGVEMLSHVYHAHDEQDIISFIDNVLAKNDEMQEVRDRYTSENITINYPYATQKAFEHLKQLLISN